MTGKTIEILFGKKGDMTHLDTAKVFRVMKQIESEKKIQPSDYDVGLGLFKNLDGDKGRTKTFRLKVNNYPGTAEELTEYFNEMVNSTDGIKEGYKIIDERVIN
jgi:hypothetical protein